MIFFFHFGVRVRVRVRVRARARVHNLGLVPYGLLFVWTAFLKVLIQSRRPCRDAISGFYKVVTVSLGLYNWLITN